VHDPRDFQKAEVAGYQWAVAELSRQLVPWQAGGHVQHKPRVNVINCDHLDIHVETHLAEAIMAVEHGHEIYEEVE
jgi:hypothetical protein